MIDRVKHIVDVIYWQIDIRHFAEEIRREYKDVVTSRIVRG
jgi:hypothetical protein